MRSGDQAYALVAVVSVFATVGTFRVGGMVKEGSVERKDLTVKFIVTDTAKEMTVTYTGILPDLFREGKGVVPPSRSAIHESDGLFLGPVIDEDIVARVHYMACHALSHYAEARKADYCLSFFNFHSSHLRLFYFLCCLYLRIVFFRLFLGYNCPQGDKDPD